MPNWLVPLCLLLFSVIALAIILERFYQLYHKCKPLDDAAMQDLQNLLSNPQMDLSHIETLTMQHPHPGLRILHKLWQQKAQTANALTQRQLPNYAQQLAFSELEKIETYMSTLNTIATTAPLLGLLGTVTGMIKSFNAFTSSQNQNSQLMGGIDEALITTALGLSVAIPVLIMHNYFAKRIQVLAEQSNILMQQALTILMAEENVDSAHT